jgi:hypothetical protein
MKPGWLPDDLGGYRGAPDVDPATHKKYDTPSPMSLNLYVLFQYVLCLVATAMFLFNAGKFSLSGQAVVTALITFTVMNCGVLFEGRRWVKWAEWFRIVSYPVLLSAVTVMAGLDAWYYGVAVIYFVISSTWFYSLQRQHENLQIA